MTISRSLMERQLRAGGGIMTLEEPRQGYFLGKLVKKAKRAVKKVVKSPIGKAALLGAGAMYAGGLGPFASGSSMFGGKLANLAGSGFLRGTGSGILSGLTGGGDGFLGQIGNVFRVGGDADNKFSALRLLGGGLGAAALAAPFMGGDEEEVVEETPFSQTPDSIASIVNMAKNQDPSLRFLPKPKFVDNFYAANGGLASLRPGYAGGQLVGPSGDGSRPGYAGESNIGILDVIKSFPGAVKEMFSGETGTFLGDNQSEKNKFMAQDMFPNIDKDTFSMIIDMNNKGAGIDEISSITGQDSKTLTDLLSILNMKADGGRIGKAEGGIMDLNGMEKDYREGGFVPLGAEERADDVPARLSKNEFVFTADAVRSAGGGDIDQGAEVMQNMMDNLEEGGTISEESQGMNPAQEMFDQSQMLENRIA